MLVKEIMSTSIKAVSPDTRLTEVVSMMCLYRYSGLPVLENGKLIGIVAEKDVLAQLFPSVDDTMQSMSTIDFEKLADDYGNILNLRVRDIMTYGAKTVSPDMHAVKAAVIMAGNRFRRIPVADGDRLVGMLSLGDVHKALFHRQFSRT